MTINKAKFVSLYDIDNNEEVIYLATIN